MTKLNKTTKKYVISSLVTFVSAFVMTVLPFIDTLKLEDVQTGAVISILFTGIRAGVKALLELLVTPPQV